MANITLFAQVIRLTPREIIQRLVKKKTFTKIDLFQWINEPFSPPPDEPEIA